MALVVGQIVQASLTMVLAWVVHPPVLPGWNLEDARGLLSYGGPYAGANLLELVQLNIDYLIVSRVLGGEALGQYSLAFRLAFMPYLMVVVVMSGAAFPYLCRQRGADLGRAAVTVMTASLTLVAPICLGLGLFADDLVLLGDKWEPGVPVVAWLALYAALLSVGQLVQTSLNAAGRPAASMALRLCHLVLLLGVLLLVARHGITAVAIGQVAVATCIALVALALARALRHRLLVATPGALAPAGPDRGGRDGGGRAGAPPSARPDRPVTHRDCSSLEQREWRRTPRRSGCSTASTSAKPARCSGGRHEGR